MWFKQIQLFDLTTPIQYSPDLLAEKLASIEFTACLPSLPSTAGWVPPLDVEGAPLVHALNGYMMICLQVEEKILPATVIRQALNDKIKKIEASEDRRLRQKEKASLKDEVIMTLLPRAFSRLTRVYAYIDTKNNQLILGTTHAGKTEQFLMLFKRCVTESIHHYEIRKLAPLTTHWLKNKSNPTIFSIEKACVLQDPQQQNRIIRAQQQDLYAASIQGLLKDGCEVKQLALSWQDRVNFVLAEDFTLRSIQYQEDVVFEANNIEGESKQERFDADFFIMAETLSGLCADLLKVVLIEEKAAA